MLYWILTGPSFAVVVNAPAVAGVFDGLNDMLLRLCFSSFPAVSGIPNFAAMHVVANVPAITGSLFLMASLPPYYVQYFLLLVATSIFTPILAYAIK
jgi:hypothetical protein